MGMKFQLQFASGKPIYLQLMDQVKAAAAAGSVGVGEALPSVRVLAEELRVNRNTVAKAYTELEREGVVETSPGRGCFIRAGASPLKKSVREQRLAIELDAVIVQAHHLQVPDADLRSLLEDRLDHFHQTRKEHGV